MSDQGEHAKATTGDVVEAIAAMAVIVAAEPNLIKLTWNWFVADPFSVPSIGYWHAVGLEVCISYFTNRTFVFWGESRFSDGSVTALARKRIWKMLLAFLGLYFANANMHVVLGN